MANPLAPHAGDGVLHGRFDRVRDPLRWIPGVRLATAHRGDRLAEDAQRRLDLVLVDDQRGRQSER